MRSLVKASSAGSKYQAGDLGRVFRGAFARDASPGSVGGGAPSARQIAIPLCILATLMAMALTTAPASATTVAATWSENVAFTEATLKTQINPEGIETTYHFEYGTSEAYGLETPELAVGSDNTVHQLARSLTGLEADTTYHYRVVTTNADGVDEGPDRTFTTFAPAPPDTDCSNQVFRVGPAANLPDCRAYEMVSPLDKNGGDILAFINGTGIFSAFKQASSDGERVTYTSGTSFGDAVASVYSNQYLSSRRPEGWTTHGISAPQGTVLHEAPGAFPFPNFAKDTYFEGFSPDLCSGWTKDVNVEPLTADAIDGYLNLYRRSNCGEEGFEALTNQGLFGPSTDVLNQGGTFSDVESTGAGVRFQGASSDLSHQVFASGAALTPNAVPGNRQQLYDLHDGQLELVSVLPGGEANPNNATVGRMGWNWENTRDNVEHGVSEDGSRIFWTLTDASQFAYGAGRIYVRIDGQTTLPVSAEAEALTGESGQSDYWTAATDGSMALFTNGLGPETSAVFPYEKDLFLFDVDKALAAEAATTLLAHRVVGVPGASDDFSRIYFVSREDLGDGAVEGDYNLYLGEEGTFNLVAVLGASDFFGAAPGVDIEDSSPGHLEPSGRTSRVTPDGRRIAFQSVSSPTGHDNVNPVDGKPYTEIFRYDAEADELACISCNPSGARPSGLPGVYPPYWGAVGDNTFDSTDFGTAATLPSWERSTNAPRALSADGSRVFFNSYEALAVGDTNGTQDVYQWEAPGSGSCKEASPNFSDSNRGCISLISTGKNSQVSEFVDASATGSDVFFTTGSGIDPRDGGLIDLYDARVGGGFPLPSAAASCEGEACQVPPEAPNDATPASSAFKGVGNVKESRATDRRCRKGKRRVRRNGTARCVRKRSGKKHAVPGHAQASPDDGRHRQANYDRRTAR